LYKNLNTFDIKTVWWSISTVYNIASRR